MNAPALFDALAIMVVFFAIAIVLICSVMAIERYT